MRYYPHMPMFLAAFAVTGWLPAQGFSEPKIRDLQIQAYDTYQLQQHPMRQGVVDPYTGQFMDNEAFIEYDYTSPHKSYRFEHQEGADEPALNYQVTSSLSLNLDPRTKRVDTNLKLGGSDTRGFKLKLHPKSIKVMFEYKW